VLDAEFWINLGVIGLFIISFIGSVFSPIPPDVVLIPLALANPENSLYYAFICTIASVLGAIVGYYMGKVLGERILKKFFRKEQVVKAKRIFTQHGAFGVFIAGFSPIPYKVFTILSGVMNFDLKKLIFVSLISRSMRFFAEGILIFHMGPEAINLLSENFEIGIIIATLFMIIGYIIYMLIKDKIKKFY
jgi:membrane protein YqaA with SNARE-associated domain